MIKVGLDYLLDKKGKKRKVSYYDIKYDLDKWVDASKYLPADYDLCYIKALNRIKTLNGWIVGRTWEGIRINSDDKVLYWKKNV